jgi:hypothetical protein
VKIAELATRLRGVFNELRPDEPAAAPARDTAATHGSTGVKS